MADRRLTGDGGSATVSYESGVAATVDFRRAAAGTGPGGLTTLEGRILGDFILGEVLGRGGCGTVYRAEQRTLGRPAVVKVVDRSPTTRRDLAERFVREARLASRFDHPYAAHVYAFGVEHDGVMWIAMELVDGTPLGQLIKQAGPLPPSQFVPLFERLCEVVQSAHDQGIVHRDIKPSNVMVIARAGRLMPKLLDFGIAKLVSGSEDTARGETWLELDPLLTASSEPGERGLTHDGQVLGSPAYMAPEQWRDARAAGPLADQYALALLGYEMLTAAHAFPGPTIEALAEQHRDAPLPALPEHLPAQLHAVLARASDKSPERRFGNLTELASAIQLAARGAPGDLDEPGATLPDDVAPYPGLAPYTAAERAWFVGRERDVDDLIDQLERQSIVTVVGPSGSGKTSFLAAGVVPSLAPRWRAELVRPGGDPLEVLAAIARQRDAPPYREGARCDDAMAPDAIASALVGLAEASSGSLVVIVDQAEELFTMCSDDAGRAGFAEALMIASASPQLRVVLALRDDFLCRVEQLPAWRGRLGRAVHVLGIPRTDDLERMLTVPARRRGYAFDDPSLPGEIVDQVADRPGALPLVAFTAGQLWEHRDRRSRQLTRAAYDRLGGVTGALVQHADGVVDRMSVPDRRLVRLVFGRLITAEGARASISRADLESSLGTPSAAAVVDRLLAARLVVSRDDDGGDRVEIIHETLATTWPRLAAWRRQDADGARLREQLAVAARHWDERGRPADLTWRGDALADLRRSQERGDHRMTPLEQAFARASIASAARARRVRLGLVALSFALLVAGIVGLVAANRKIAHQRAEAVERLSAGFEERGRAAIADGQHARAMLYLAEAARLGARGPGLDLLTSHAAVSLDGGLEIIGHRSAGVWAMDVDPTTILALSSDYAMTRWDRTGTKTHLADGVYHATLVGGLAITVSVRGDVTAVDPGGQVRWRAERAVADLPMRSGIAGSAPGELVIAFGRNATLRDLRTGRSRGDLPHDKDVSAVALDADGTRAATGDIGGAVRIWDTRTTALAITCAPHAGIVRALAFAPDGRTLVSAGNDGEVRICDAATGQVRHRLLGHGHQVVTVDISADGGQIASGGRDGKPRIWDAETGLLIRVLEGHRGTVIVAKYAPDGHRLLTVGLDGTARIWDREGVALGSLQGHGGAIFDGRWDPDGRHVITAGIDGTVRRWDPDRAIRTAQQRAHAEAITDLAVSKGDRWALTASHDDQAILWDRRTLQPIARLAHGAKVRSVAFAPDGTRALTTDDTGRARIWQLPRGAAIATLSTGITAATYARDGRVITAGDGSVRFWTPSGSALGAVPLDYAAEQLVLDPSGRWLFVRGPTRSVLVIDTAAGVATARLDVRDREVRSIAADAARVAIPDDTAIRLWQLGTWRPLDTLAGHKSYVTGLWFGSEGRLVSASAEATLVWGADAQLTARLPDIPQVLTLAASPDGSLLATTGGDGEIRIWDAATSHLLLQLPAHRLPATTLRFTHDGTAAISGGNDGRLVTWDLARRARSAAELAEIVRCRVPLRLDGDVALPRELEVGDPACRSLVLDR